MKKLYIIIGVAIVIIGIIVFLVIRKKEEIKVEIKDVTILRLSYTKGYMMNANVVYEFYYDKQMDKYMVSVKPYLIDEDDRVIVQAPEGFRDKLKDILIKYDLGKWNGFKKYDQNVLDGDSFSFHVKMEEDEIEADGYMMWPENYSSVRTELDELFMEIYNHEKANTR